MIDKVGNIFSNIPSPLSGEFFQNLAEIGNVRIERIVSDGQATPAGQCYDQSWDEWVILLSGSAGICFTDQARELKLLPGDHLLIPAGCRHRVTWTNPDQKTVWLAVHINSSKQKDIKTT